MGGPTRGTPTVAGEILATFCAAIVAFDPVPISEPPPTAAFITTPPVGTERPVTLAPMGSSLAVEPVRLLVDEAKLGIPALEVFIPIKPLLVSPASGSCPVVLNGVDVKEAAFDACAFGSVPDPVAETVLGFVDNKLVGPERGSEPVSGPGGNIPPDPMSEGVTCVVAVSVGKSDAEERIPRAASAGVGSRETAGKPVVPLVATGVGLLDVRLPGAASTVFLVAVASVGSFSGAAVVGTAEDLFEVTEDFDEVSNCEMEAVEEEVRLERALEGAAKLLELEEDVSKSSSAFVEPSALSASSASKSSSSGS